MSVYIFTNRINGKLGYDNSLISTANHLSRYYDMKIITYGQNLYATNFSQNTKFKLRKDIEVITLKNVYVDGVDSTISKYKVVNTYTDKHYKIEQTEFDIKALEYIFSKMTSDDFIIIGNEYSSLFLHMSGLNPPCRTMMQVHFDLEQTSLDKETIYNVLNYPTYVQPVSNQMKNRLSVISKRDLVDFIHISNYSPDVKEVKISVLNKKIRFGVVGSITQRKGQLEAIKAISKLRKSELLIYGELGDDNSSKHYFEEIEAFIKEKNIAHKVKFMGFASQDEIYKQIDISLIPSTIEGFPYSGLEAMKFGKPIITYDYNYGSSELVANKNGFLISSNWEDMYKKMKWFERHRYSYKKFVKNSTALYNQKYSESIVDEKFKKVIGNSIRNSALQNVIHSVGRKFDFEILNLDRNSITFKLHFGVDNVFVVYKNQKMLVECIDNTYMFNFENGYTTSFFSFEKNDITTYIFNLNNKAEAAIHSFYSNNIVPQEDNNIYEFENKYYVKNYTSDRVISVTNSFGHDTPFAVNYLLIDGMHQNVIIFEENSEKYSIEFSKKIIEYRKK